jgi:hypothetical protein
MTAPPLCLNCKHFIFADITANTCAAFPAGVPDDIYSNRADHRRPFPGDNGTRFEAIDAAVDPPEFGDAGSNE